MVLPVALTMVVEMNTTMETTPHVHVTASVDVDQVFLHNSDENLEL